jgi:hypothetical protein
MVVPYHHLGTTNDHTPDTYMYMYVRAMQETIHAHYHKHESDVIRAGRVRAKYAPSLQNPIQLELDSNVTAVHEPSSLQHAPSARDPLSYTIITYIRSKQRSRC